MKRLSTGVAAALLAAGLGLNAVAASATSAPHGNIGPNAVAQAPETTTAPPPNFGSPPSGQIPILYNDHHVYTKPDVLKQDRVLAALVSGNTILIPLRSMFEQMGATVSYDAASKTVDVSKAGADVKVTVGKPEVIVNGESRPLDVPPIIYNGIILVPVRVISEGMGAYVLWVPDQHLVVVRYIPPTPPPPPPTAAPPPPPPPSPTPAPPRPYHDLYVAGDYISSPKVYDQFSPGNTGSNVDGGFSYRIHGAAEFDALGLPWMIEADYRQFNYPHNCSSIATPSPSPSPTIEPDSFARRAIQSGGDPATDPECYVTNIGSTGSSIVPTFTVRSYDVDTHLGIRVLEPRIYIGVGYMWRSGNYGYPHLDNWGFGASKLPDLDHPFSWQGSVYYYPNTKGNYGAYTVSYNVLKYDLGVIYSFVGAPVFIEAGWLGERGNPLDAAPIGFTMNGPYAGIGIKF